MRQYWHTTMTMLTHSHFVLHFPLVATSFIAFTFIFPPSRPNEVVICFLGSINAIKQHCMGEGDVVQCNRISMHGGEHYELSGYEHIPEGQRGRAGP